MKKIISFIALLLPVLCMLCPIVRAAGGTDFRLTDAQCQKGRLLYTTLCVSGGEDTAAFLADIQYDADTLSFRSAKAVTGTVRVNSAVSGRLTMAYLCENGIGSKRAELVELCFRAETATASRIELEVRQLIDTSGADMAVGDTVGAAVTATSGSGSGQAEKPGKAPNKSDSTDSTNSGGVVNFGATADSAGTIIIEKNSPGFPIGAGVALAALVCTGVAAAAYRLGKKRPQSTSADDGKKQAKIPGEGGQIRQNIIESDNSEEKDEKNS